MSLLWERNDDGKLPKVTHDGKYLEVIQSEGRHNWLRIVFVFGCGNVLEGLRIKTVKMEDN